MKYLTLLILGMMLILCFTSCSNKNISDSRYGNVKRNENVNCDSLQNIYFPKIDSTNNDSTEVPYFTLTTSSHPASIRKGWSLLDQSVDDSQRVETVFVYVIVDKNGRVKCPQVASPNYNEENILKAIKVVRELKYTPALKGEDKEPYVSYMVIPVKFRYKHKK